MGLLSLKVISDKYKVGITDFFTPAETPSVLFKRMLKVSTEPVEDDNVFDEYMMRPENKEKLDLLKCTTYMLESSVFDYKVDLKDEIAWSVEIEIIKDARTSMLKRLKAYATRLQDLKQQKSDGFGKANGTNSENYHIMYTENLCFTDFTEGKAPDEKNTERTKENSGSHPRSVDGDNPGSSVGNVPDGGVCSRSCR